MSSVESESPQKREEQYGGVELLGISHRTASVDILERLALAPEEIQKAYERLFADGHEDVMVLSTCNRTELYVRHGATTTAAQSVYHALEEIAGRERVPEDEFLYRHSGRESVEHLFRVACGLDSMILGEQQILGQVKSAYEVARQFKEPSRYFDQVIQAAFKVAKRSRADTDIGKGAVSVASAGVHLATRIYGDLSKRQVAVIGAGETGRLVAEHFNKLGPKNLVILNRTLERAERVARDLAGTARPMDELPAVIAESDIVACAVGVQEPLISVDMVEKAMKHRSGWSLALIDLGMPRNVNVAVHDLTNVFVHDIEALRQVVDSNLKHRKREVPRVEELIQDQLDKLLSWHRSTQVGPFIAALRESVENMRQAEVNKVAKGLGDAERQAVDKATRAVVNKLLHGPMSSIKEFARQQEEGVERLELVRQVFSNFDLDEDE